MALKKYVRFMLMYLLFTCFIVGISFQLQCYSAFAATGEGTVSTDEVISPVPNYTAGNGQAVILMYHHLVTNEDYNTCLLYTSRCV